MALKLYNDTDIQNIADSIRAKTGSNNLMTVGEMANEIDSIPTGTTPTGTIAISQNGTYDVTNYASANVNVSGGGVSFTIDDAQYLFYNNARLNIMNELLSACDNVTNCNNMFYQCSSLTSLDLSNFKLSAVTSMNRMFNGCSSLTSLEIGTDDTTYSSNLSSQFLFYYCTNLNSVTIRGTNVMMISSSNAFTGLKSTCKFYVPSNLVSSYKSATNWSLRADYIYAIS